MKPSVVPMLACAIALTAAAVGRARPEAMTIAILVDVTGSMHVCPGGVAGLPSSTKAGSGTTMTSMLDRRPIPPAVEEFPLVGIDATDRVRLGAISRRFTLSDPIAGGSAELRKAWRALFDMPPVEWLGPSPIWDATAETVRTMSADAGKRAIVLVTDGLASGNRVGATDAAFAARWAGIPVTVVAAESVLPAQSMSVIGRDPLTALSELARMSGGRFLVDRAIGSGDPCFRRDTTNTLWTALRQIR